MIPLFYSFQIGNPIVRGLQPYHKIGCNSVTPITTLGFDDFDSGTPHRHMSLRGQALRDHLEYHIAFQRTAGSRHGDVRKSSFETLQRHRIERNRNSRVIAWLYVS